MKVVWIIIFVVLFIFNLFHFIGDSLLPFLKEFKKKTKDGTSTDTCSYLDSKNDCKLYLVRVWKKLRKEKTTVCPGAEDCIFFVSENADTGEIVRSNVVFLILDSLFSHIPSLTALIITFYEIVNMFEK